MSIDLTKRIDMACPVCGEGFHQTLGWLAKHYEVICPHCGSSYEVRISDPEALGDEGAPVHGSSFFTKIAGVTHRNADRKSRQRLIAQCRVGEELVLEREPNNPVDPNAIKVLRVSGEQLGYIRAQVAASGLARDLDRGERPKCRIKNLTGGDGLTRGVNIEIGDWQADSHPAEAAIPNESANRNESESPRESTAPIGWIILVLAIIVGAVLVILRFQ
jgi:hypothetical protein